MAEQKSDDYKSRLNKARNKRNGKDPMKYFMYAAGGIIVILLVVVAVKDVYKRQNMGRGAQGKHRLCPGCKGQRCGDTAGKPEPHL